MQDDDRGEQVRRRQGRRLRGHEPGRRGDLNALRLLPEDYDANVFAKPLSEETFAKLNSEANGAPLVNRAT